MQHFNFPLLPIAAQAAISPMNCPHGHELHLAVHELAAPWIAPDGAFFGGNSNHGAKREIMMRSINSWHKVSIHQMKLKNWSNSIHKTNSLPCWVFSRAIFVCTAIFFYFNPFNNATTRSICIDRSVFFFIDIICISQSGYSWACLCFNASKICSSWLLSISIRVDIIFSTKSPPWPRI